MARSSRGERALCQSMYLLDAEHRGRDEWRFEVQGSMGVSYDLDFTQNAIKCSCPDFYRRKETCKHCFFIVGRVLSDLELMRKMEHKCEPMALFMADFSSRMEERIRMKHTVPLAASSTEDCVVCFESLACSGHDVWECSGCRKRCLHMECARRWLQKNNSCPLCRHPASPSHDPFLVFRQEK